MQFFKTATSALVAAAAAAAILLLINCSGSHQAPAEESIQPPSCKDLRNSSNQLACDRRAVRAWLAASKETSNLDLICHDDLVEFPKQCNMTADLEEKLKLSEQHMNKALLKSLKEYLNEPLIELYMEEHPNEPGLHLGNRRQGNCCQALYDFPIENVTNNLIAEKAWFYIEGEEKSPYKVPFEVLEPAVGFLMADYIFRPCGRYLHIQDDMLLGPLRNSVKKFMGDQWKFLEHHSKEFRNAIFRYQFCSNPDFKARIFDDHYEFWHQDDELDDDDDDDDHEEATETSDSDSH